MAALKIPMDGIIVDRRYEHQRTLSNHFFFYKDKMQQLLFLSLKMVASHHMFHHRYPVTPPHLKIRKSVVERVKEAVLSQKNNALLIKKQIIEIGVLPIKIIKRNDNKESEIH